ncbi:MAG: hypothetical protein JSS83_13100 [Cyanobacteria bacterium SZAS LIN-3]|nr:hypothetical protein [Cyanobacteria bacterium SZAS LIN-3]
MLTGLTVFLALTAAIISIPVMFRYPTLCSALERHLASPRPDYREDKEGFSAWQQCRWALDKTRTRCALLGLGAYAVGMISLIPAMQFLKTAPGFFGFPAETELFGLMLVITGNVLVIGLRSTIHNGREFELDLKRRYPLS